MLTTDGIFSFFPSMVHDSAPPETKNFGRYQGAKKIFLGHMVGIPRITFFAQRGYRAKLPFVDGHYQGPTRLK
jgi:hypothetical protein